MNTAKTRDVPGFAIAVAGTPVDPAVLTAVAELVVDRRLRVPDRLSLAIHDDDQAIMRAATFVAGAALTITLASAEQTSRGPVFDGLITTLAPEFDEGTATLVVIALDRGCLLQQAPDSASYQDTSYGDIATKLARAAGLSPGTIDAGLTLPFVQRSNETPWDFLWRLAAEVDYEVKAEGTKLHFRPAGGDAHSQPLELTVGEELRSFRPRITASQQATSVSVRGWDPVGASAIVADAGVGTTQSTPGLTRGDVATALSDSIGVVVDHPVANAAHASTLARSLGAQIANTFVEAEGVALGTPSLSPGNRVKVAGIAPDFAGTYALSGVRHVLRGDGGFETELYAEGRADRTLLGLTADSPAPDAWQRRVVVGIVTNNDDPEQSGRVRVRYPTLEDTEEGWWARVVAPGAGLSRGFVTLPKIGDEVLVVFEHGDERHPYVLGSVFNGQAKPEDLATTDGSFGLTSDMKLTVKTADAMALTSAKTLALVGAGDTKLTTKGEGEGVGNVEVSSKGTLTLAADSSGSLTANTSMAVEGQTTLSLQGGTEVKVAANGEVKISAPMITLEASGIVRVSGTQVLLG